MLELNTRLWVALVLLTVGGLNWGLVGLFKFNLVSTIFGEMSLFARLIYVAVAVSAVAVLVPALIESKK